MVKLKDILSSPYTIPLGVGLTSFALGVGAGYILRGRKTIEVETETIRQLTFDFDTPKMDEIFEEAVPNVTVEELKTRLEAFDDRSRPQDATVVSIFDRNDDDWDWDEENASRSEDAPYVLHRDEFYADERDYFQHTLCYYTGDDIMCDEDETPVYNYKKTIGTLEFGHGSGDPNVFYVRNPKLKAEYEVLKYDGHFAIEVMGLEMETEEDELKHSLRKFKRDG